MTARLTALCALIERTQSFIDVGCDHGYAVEYVVKHRLAKQVTACDISAPSLEKAKRRLGENSGVTFVCADGATAADGYETVLVGGMGGLEILSICAGCSPRVFILSPQSHVCDVRKYLLERDYDIVYDRVIKDGKKFYDILKATRGGGLARLAHTQNIQLTYGMFIQEHNDALVEKLRNLQTAIQSYPRTDENVRKSEEIKETLAWQQR